MHIIQPHTWAQNGVAVSIDVAAQHLLGGVQISD